MHGWAARLDESGKLGEIEKLILQAGFGEYLNQMRGGIALSQGEIARPHDIGIAPADIPRAFDPFQQIEATLERRYEGTGLGLPLSRALAELHDGELTLESEVGRGTTVTIRLPPERIAGPAHTPA